MNVGKIITNNKRNARKQNIAARVAAISMSFTNTVKYTRTSTHIEQAKTGESPSLSIY